MKRFSELNICVKEDRKIFECKQVSITDIINSEIQIIDFIPDMKTKFGEDRYLILFSNDGVEGKFFSNSRMIKNVLDAIPEEDFPFVTTIKCLKCGANKIYKFT